MDPLSIVASCIAVVQAATASEQGLSKLLSLRKAPAELQTLHNEVEALRSLLLLLRNTLQHIRESDRYREAQEPLRILLRPVQQGVEELHALVEYRLKRSEEMDKHGLPKVSKIEFLTANIEGVKRKIRDARDNLDAGIGALNLHHSETNRQIALQIQSITFETRSDVRQIQHDAADTSRDIRARLHDQAAFHMNHQQALNSLGAQLEEVSTNGLRRSDVIGLRTAQQADLEPLRLAIAQQQAQQVALAQNLKQLRDDNAAGFKTLAVRQDRSHMGLYQGQILERSAWTSGAEDDSQHASQPRDESRVRITATLTTEKCPLGCRCQCHSRTSFKTPPWLKNVLGQLMFDYTALMQAKPCDYRPCRKSPRRSQFTYYFPAWMASRALTISGLAQDLAGPGASWTIRVPIVVESDELVWSAVRDGNIGVLQGYFSTRRYSPFIVDEFGQALIHRAVVSGAPAVYQLLLSLGADPQSQDNAGSSANSVALHFAQDERQAYGIDAETVADDMVFTPLHLALVLPSSSPSLDSTLLEQQFRNRNEPDRLGRTPLHWACVRDNPAAVTLLLQWGSDVSLRDRSGRSALHYACICGNAACVTALFDAGAAANVVDADGNSPVMLLRNSNAHLVGLLVDHGANVNHQDSWGRTALHCAAEWDREEVVGRLLQAGADPLITDHRGRLPIHMAVMYDCTDALSCFLCYFLYFPSEATDFPKPDVTSSPQPTPRSVGTEVPLKQQDRPYYWRADDFGHNILRMAALFAGTEVMRILAGADLRGVDPLCKDKYGTTPDDCFYKLRDDNCTIIRPPIEEEEAAWNTLMASARRQNGLGVESDEDTSSNEDASGEDEQTTDDECGDLAGEEDAASEYESAVSEDGPETSEIAAEII